MTVATSQQSLQLAITTDPETRRHVASKRRRISEAIVWRRARDLAGPALAHVANDAVRNADMLGL